MVATQTARPPGSFVPAQVDLSDVSQVLPLYQTLLDRPISTKTELEKWLKDFSDLSSAVDEYGARRYVDKSCHTDDPEIERRYLQHIEDLEKIYPLDFRLQKKLLDCPFHTELDPQKYGMLLRNWRAEVEIFRDENMPIETQISRLENEYNNTVGQTMIHFRGSDYTPQQMDRFQQDPDRTTRKEAWEAVAKRRLEDREKIDSIYEKLLPLRQKIASNARLQSYRDYAWKANKRFDYTPDDCLKFADAIEQYCLPLVTKLNERRAADLGIPKLRPWDLEVDPKNRPPLQPFPQQHPEILIDRTKEIFKRVSPALAADFDQLIEHDNLDLQTRKGKQPGGYQCSLEETRQPFIFMNAAGLERDVEILLHEGGHAFHYLAASRNQPLVFLRSAPMEFNEVASMSMELLGSDHLDVFYNQAEADRARRKLLEGIIRFLPWMAIIDSFQHWIYMHENHSRAQRDQQWISLMDRFRPGIDWSG
ncbi:MAG TPA: M3 family oligoendopeptidase, partial [Tepidisphaeraceae bacterium]|nr:M3 family oligoendopeptidase [Tepidisphaeraceae bacterium]